MAKRAPDFDYCVNSFLQFRFVEDETKCFAPGIEPRFATVPVGRRPVTNSVDLERELRCGLAPFTDPSKNALMLSGGIDSGILARMVPAGMKAYTLKCMVDNAVDETKAAKITALKNRLEHEVIPVTWEDHERLLPELLRFSKYPVHSIAIQILKAARHARKDGFENLIFGETADILYGGLSGLLSREYTAAEFFARYNYVDPVKVLRYPAPIYTPYERHTINGRVDVHGFINDVLLREALGSYTFSCELGGVGFVAPYSGTYLAAPLDLVRIRTGENKYVVRNVFSMLYPNLEQAEKIPMPRPLDIWMKEYAGPKNAVFRDFNVADLSPDQKWYVHSLDVFLTMLKEGAL